MKIFNIGLSKTGTKSFITATKLLGYKSVHLGGRPITLEQMETIDSFGDSNSCWFMYQQFYNDYSDSMFVYSVRDRDEWVQRILEWYNPKWNISYIRWHLENIWIPVVDTEEELKDFFEEHQQGVRNFFKDKQDRFLEHNVFEGDGWKSLCKFLKCDTPPMDYPSLKNERVK